MPQTLKPEQLLQLVELLSDPAYAHLTDDPNSAEFLALVERVAPEITTTF